MSACELFCITILMYPQQQTVMEFNECRPNEVLDPVDLEFYSARSRTPSPAPVLTTNVCCDLEDILSDVRTLISFSRFIYWSIMTSPLIGAI